MKRTNFFLITLLSLVLASSTWATTVNVSGVKLAEAISLRGTPLILNGAGVRHKGTSKIYVIGLYLGKKIDVAGQILSNPEPKRISLTMFREIDSNELGKLFIRGVEDNMSKNDLPYLVPGLSKMGRIFAEQNKLNTGDVVLLDWVPGTGTVLTVRGKQVAEFKEPEFYTALLRIWLGDSPVDGKLKEALLGKMPQAQ